MVYKKYIELEKAHLYLIEEGFTLLIAKDKVEIQLKDAIEIDDISYDLVEGKPFVTLADMRNIRSNITHEAREHFATNKKITDIRKAQSIIVNSLHTKILANFYMKFHKPKNPVKIFSDYDKAEKWVREIRSKWYK
ncbi:MAG: hypothetical protein JKX68_00730 [Flavobacteriales bacterium]|nr:hypothetical protein [Flavobacteriales bacterium]